MTWGKLHEKFEFVSLTWDPGWEASSFVVVWGPGALPTSHGLSDIWFLHTSRQQISESWTMKLRTDWSSEFPYVYTAVQQIFEHCDPLSFSKVRYSHWTENIHTSTDFLWLIYLFISVSGWLLKWWNEHLRKKEMLVMFKCAGTDVYSLRQVQNRCFSSVQSPWL